MRIKSGRNYDQVRLCLNDGGQKIITPARPDTAASGAISKRQIENILIGSGFLISPGTREKRHLMGRGIKQTAVIPETGLRSVAVMDVKIQHRNTVYPPFFLRMTRRNRGTGKQTKAHGLIRLGMMTGWPH